MCDSEFKIESGRLPKYISNLLLSSVLSDVTFCIGGERIPAHKLVLASREHFQELLFGDKEINVIVLQEVGAKAFKEILKYIYNDTLLLGAMELEQIIDILRLAHTYKFKDLIGTIESYLEQKISIETVYVLLDLSQQLALDTLREECLEFMDEKASTILVHEKFSTISKVNEIEIQIYWNIFAL